MVMKQLSEELYKLLTPIRESKIDKFIERPLLAKPDNKVSEIIGVLKENNAYQLFMKYKDDIISVNIRDILEYKNIHTAKLSMIGKVIQGLSKDDTIAKASGLMSHYRVRALPVIDDDNIIGQVSSNTLIQRLSSMALNIKASSIMSANPIIIKSDEKAAGAKNIMIKNKIDHLPVVDGRKPLAILTSMHLLNILIPPERVDMMTPKQKGVMGNLNFPIKAIAEYDPLTTDVRSSINNVIDALINKRSSYILVTLSEEIQGIITTRDIVALMQEMIKDEIPAYIVGLPEDPIEAELAKSKFISTLRLLRRSYPDIIEARCKIKVKDITGERRRYELDMHIITPKERITYVDLGWDLANLFDTVSNALKKHLEKSKIKRSKESIRYRGEEEYKV